MKKILALLLVLALSLTLVACGSGKKDAASTGSYKVAMVTDDGDSTDQSFNQTTWEAVVAFGKDNNVETKYYKPTSNDTAGRVASVELAIAEGYNVIVMPGYAFGGTIVDVAPNYPDVKFVALDVAKGDLLETAVANKGESYDYNPDNWKLEDYVDMSNVYCAIYQEELAGYMAGYAAVKLGYTKLGFLGGMAVPAVIRYGYGYVQGVDAAAKELGITVDMKYAYGNQFYGDADITAVMDTWYADGTEVVFACGGGIYTSAAEAAKKVNAKVIGVDVDQKGIIDGDYGEGMTVTSAMKGLRPTTINALTDIIVNGKWADYAGKIETLGLVSGDDPAANYVQLAETTQFADGKFSKDDYAALVKGMFDGTITAHDLPAEWNRLYKEYLGVDVPDDRQGVLQDSHWSNGNIGYFPSYAIGSAYGAQYLLELSKELDVDSVVRSGDLTPINNWLEEKIWKYGCMKDPVALFESVCGKFDPDCYVAYLEKKFTEVYGL